MHRTSRVLSALLLLLSPLLAAYFRRVWRSALVNLASGRDARRPFVDAFADEQLMGFTKYYTIILEHSKHNIAGGRSH